MRPGIKFYTKLEETSLEPKKYNKELKEAGLSGKDILFTERKEHSGNYIVFFENNGIYEYHPYDNINGLASGQKARTLEACISRAHCMGLYENDTGVAKPMKAADGLLDVKVNIREAAKADLTRNFDFHGDGHTDYEGMGFDAYYSGVSYFDCPIKHPEWAYYKWKEGWKKAESASFKESNKTSKNRLKEKMYTDELSDQLESDILSAASENADGPHVVLTDILETLEYVYGYNYKGELYPNLSVIAKYLEQSGYIVEE